MRLLCINPWIEDFAAANLWARPLGLLRVAEMLSAYTPHLTWIDCLEPYVPGRYGAGKYPKTILPAPAALRGIPRRFGRYGMPENEFRSRLRTALPADAILITSVMTYWYTGVQAVIRICRELAPGTPVILGGIYARLCPDHARRHSGADVICAETAEDGLERSLREAGLDPRPVREPQPWYRLALCPPRPYAPLLASEGCPYACAYCASSRLFSGYRRRNAEGLWRDLLALIDFGARDFAFYDDALLFEAGAHLVPWLERVCAERLAVRFHTPNGLHARFVTPELARLLRRSGFRTLRLSLETVSPERQVQTGGKISTPEFAAAVDCFFAAGFGKSELGVYLMYGLPGQTWEEVKAGVRYLQGLGVRINLTEYSPLPGTPLWNDLVRRGTIPPDLDPLLTNNSVFSRLFAGYRPEEIDALKTAVAAYNNRPN